MKRSLLYIILIILLLAVAAKRIFFVPLSHSYSSRNEIKTGATASENDSCKDSLWPHVYHPRRLKIIRNCITVSGFIEDKKKEDDGDIHIRLRLDPPLDTLLNKANMEYQNGCLVVEIICAERAKEADPAEACSNYSNQVFIPHKGAHVQVTGPLVMDSHHDWMEIHPATEIRLF